METFWMMQYFLLLGMNYYLMRQWMKYADRYHNNERKKLNLELEVNCLRAVLKKFNPGLLDFHDETMATLEANYVLTHPENPKSIWRSDIKDILRRKKRCVSKK